MGIPAFSIFGNFGLGLPYHQHSCRVGRTRLLHTVWWLLVVVTTHPTRCVRRVRDISTTNTQPEPQGAQRTIAACTVAILPPRWPTCCHGECDQLSQSRRVQNTRTKSHTHLDCPPEPRIPLPCSMQADHKSYRTLLVLYLAYFSTCLPARCGRLVCDLILWLKKHPLMQRRTLESH